jgi:hypothetical protein
MQHKWQWFVKKTIKLQIVNNWLDFILIVFVFGLITYDYIFYRRI